MNIEQLEKIIEDLTILQIFLNDKRIDYHGVAIKKDDIEQIQMTIDIINNLIIEKDYIWKNKNQKKN